MSAEAFGKSFPAVVTLDDVVAMNAADRFGHRFELSPQGALSVMPPSDAEHAAIVSRLMFWLAVAGWPAEQVLQAVGIRIPGPEGEGGRIPDLTLWAKPLRNGVWLPMSDLLLVVEVVSPSSAAIDQGTKVAEYASAGIPKYWVVDRDAARTVTLHTLTANTAYEVTAKLPLAWLLQSNPVDHQLGA